MTVKVTVVVAVTVTVSSTVARTATEPVIVAATAAVIRDIDGLMERIVGLKFKVMTYRCARQEDKAWFPAHLVACPVLHNRGVFREFLAVCEDRERQFCAELARKPVRNILTKAFVRRSCIPREGTTDHGFSEIRQDAWHCAILRGVTPHRVISSLERVAVLEAANLFLGVIFGPRNNKPVSLTHVPFFFCLVFAFDRRKTCELHQFFATHRSHTEQGLMHLRHSIRCRGPSFNVDSCARSISNNHGSNASQQNLQCQSAGLEALNDADKKRKIVKKHDWREGASVFHVHMLLVVVF